MLSGYPSWSVEIGVTTSMPLRNDSMVGSASLRRYPGQYLTASLESTIPGYTWGGGVCMKGKACLHLKTKSTSQGIICLGYVVTRS
jgi:hypothetical protein